MFLFLNKKGMEMWIIIFIILALLLLFFVIAWYAGLGKQLGYYVDKMGDLL